MKRGTSPNPSEGGELGGAEYNLQRYIRESRKRNSWQTKTDGRVLFLYIR
jgi:hypothetical protein